jgi:hypothetical protein
MIQALASEWGHRYDVVDSHLTAVPAPRAGQSSGGSNTQPDDDLPSPDLA